VFRIAMRSVGEERLLVVLETESRLHDGRDDPPHWPDLEPRQHLLLERKRVVELRDPRRYERQLDHPGRGLRLGEHRKQRPPRLGADGGQVTYRTLTG